MNKLNEIISEQLNIDMIHITLNSTLDELCIDSLDIIEIIMSIEEAYNIDIDDSKISEITKVSDLALIINQQHKDDND